MIKNPVPFILSLGMFVFISSCNKSSYFALIIKDANRLKSGSKVSIQIKNSKNKTIDSIDYLFQGNLIKSKNGHHISLEQAKLGRHLVKAIVYYEDKADTISKKVTIFSKSPPRLYKCKIINTYAHDIEAYTQGLEFYKDTLYESTGLYGQSTLRKVDYKTGEVLKKIDLSKAYFGEGLTILNDQIHQLTWKSKFGLVYDLNFNKTHLFSYNKSKEGWGLCNDGNYLYKSDGTEKIWLLNPNTLEEESHIQICSDKDIFSKANELEWVNGKIYANAYLKDGIMIINPQDGAILGVIDCRDLKDKVTQHDKLDALNGIAYNHKTNTFFVTGKNWDKLFEVQFIDK